MFKFLIRTIQFALALLGAYALIFNFLPRLQVDPGNRVERGDLFSVPFVVENAHLIPLLQTTISCRVLEARDEKRNTYRDLRSEWQDVHIGTLWPHSRATLYCRSPIHFGKPATLSSATVLVLAEFRSVTWWPKHEQTYCFSFSATVEGGEQWLPEARCPASS